MGKEWLMLLMVVLANDPVAKTEPPKVSPPAAVKEGKTTPPPNPSSPPNSAAKQAPPATQAKCDAGPYRSLIGRTISDVLTTRLPPGTRIYRVGDPVTEPVPPGRLSIEINRGTRVGRIYCS